MRTLLACVLGAVFSLALFLAEGFYVTNFTKGGRVVADVLFSINPTDAVLVAKYGGDPFELIRSMQRTEKFVLQPLIAIAVAILVGFVDSSRPRLSATVALAPWIALNLAHLHWGQSCKACLGMDVALNAAYLGIGIMTAHYCGRLRRPT